MARTVVMRVVLRPIMLTIMIGLLFDVPLFRSFSAVVMSMTMAWLWLMGPMVAVKVMLYVSLLIVVTFSTVVVSVTMSMFMIGLRLVRPVFDISLLVVALCAVVVSMAVVRLWLVRPVVAMRVMCYIPLLIITLGAVVVSMTVPGLRLVRPMVAMEIMFDIPLLIITLGTIMMTVAMFMPRLRLVRPVFDIPLLITLSLRTVMWLRLVARLRLVAGTRLVTRFGMGVRAVWPMAGLRMRVVMVRAVGLVVPVARVLRPMMLTILVRARLNRSRLCAVVRLWLVARLRLMTWLRMRMRFRSVWLVTRLRMRREMSRFRLGRVWVTSTFCAHNAVVGACQDFVVLAPCCADIIAPISDSPLRHFLTASLSCTLDPSILGC